MKIHPMFQTTRLALAAAVALAGTTSLYAQEEVIPAAGPLVAFEQDFQSIAVGSESPLKNTDLFDTDGWIIFGNVFSSDLSSYIGGYGAFYAPNNTGEARGPEDPMGENFGGAFSNVEEDNGNRYLNIFNDYKNDAEHNAGNQVNSVFFKNHLVAAEDVGETWEFKFDYRNANDGNGVADDTTGISSAQAFVKVLDSAGGSFQPVGPLSTLDVSDATNTFESATLSFEITSDHVGQELQFGFENFSRSYSPTGVYYDNLSFNVEGAALLGDFDGDGDVDLQDLDQYNGSFGAAPVGELADLDLNDDNAINAADFEIHYGQLVETQNGGVTIKGTALGDLNLDGKVDVLNDAFDLIENLGSVTATSWAQGDLDANGRVDVLGDAFALIENLGADNSATAANPSASAVPEPGSLSLLGLLSAGLVSCRRRR